MRYVYTILGAGRQGTAAAYDLALRGEASEIRLVDADQKIAADAAARVLRLIGAAPGKPAIPALRPVRCDVRDLHALAEVLKGSHAALSALPYRFNLQAARAAVDAACHFNDLGGNTAIVREELALDSRARRAGVTIVPDCGLAPGMCQTLAVYAISKIERPRHVRIRCGGLPQTPRPPLGYRLVFHVAGLTNEYTGSAVCLRNGKVVELPAFTELEDVDFPMPVGKCEAFLTSGGTSTAPWTFEGKLETYEYKVVRYRGHFERFRTLIDLGFLETRPIAVDGQKIVPRDVTEALLEERLTLPDDPDLVVLRVECSGGDAEPVMPEPPHRGRSGPSGSEPPHPGHPGVPPEPESSGAASYRIDLIDFQDAPTGFTAMERTTAFPAAIVTHLQASGAVPPGAAPVETAVPADRFLSLLERRGFKIVHARM